MSVCDTSGYAESRALVLVVKRVLLRDTLQVSASIHGTPRNVDVDLGKDANGRMKTVIKTSSRVTAYANTQVMMARTK